MIVTSITAHTVKAQRPYVIAGQARETEPLPTTDYVQYLPYLELYGRRTEAMVVRVETDEGIVGWGEAQAPVAPEVAQTIVEKVVGPVVLGRDPFEVSVRYFEMYATLRVRGQITGFQLDAIAAIDTALWDIRGKALGQPVSALLGGRFRETLPCYVSGLLASTRGQRAEEAEKWVTTGISGIKPLLGFGVTEDRAEVEAIRAVVGDSTRIFADGLWKYSYPQAVRMGRMLESQGVEFFEAPMLPEDVAGHAKLAAELDIAVAVGEPLRTRFQFQPWFLAGALDICQPDVMRTGITETVKIATLAEAFNIPVALHNGAVTVVGMAATWHTAAAIPNFFVQECEPQMLETFNPWLVEPLCVTDGELAVPTGPGLGIEFDEERMLRDVERSVHIALR